MSSQLTLTTGQTCEAIRKLEGYELPERTLAIWAERDIVRPAFWPRVRGRHGTRHYTLADVRRIRLVVRMRQAGVSMQKVRRVLDYIDGHAPDIFKRKSSKCIAIEGWRVVLRSGSQAVEVPSGQAVMVFHLAELSRATRETVRKASRG